LYSNVTLEGFAGIYIVTQILTSLNNLLMFSGASMIGADGALEARGDSLNFREVGLVFGRGLTTMTWPTVLLSFDLSLLRGLLPMLKKRKCGCYDVASKMFVICCCAKRLHGAAYPKSGVVMKEEPLQMTTVIYPKGDSNVPSMTTTKKQK
jgi:hypothetical protein